jgi:hypothetical protein
MKTEVKHDYLENNRELNLDLTLQEASLLYTASATVKGMAETG